MKIKAAASFFFLICSDLATQVATLNPEYRVFNTKLSWLSAKLGSLAVLDTREEYEHFRSSVTLPWGCLWIGASTRNNDTSLRWLQVPSSFSNNATGPLVTATFNTLLKAFPLNNGEENGMCHHRFGRWREMPANTRSAFVCEQPICGPGMFYGQNGRFGFWCPREYIINRACVPCPGNKVKTVSGNAESLCVNACDMRTTVPNSDRSGCVCAAGYYRDPAQDSCVLCGDGQPNTFKPTPGNATTCTSCGSNAVSTADHTTCECIAGHYLNSGVCDRCPVNSIKSNVGNDTSCSPCDGTSAVSNDEHTACVCNAGYFGTGSDSCTLCTGNMAKPEVGDAATCDTVCAPESGGPSEDRTMCDCLPGYRWVY